jgi:hypothetical protein
VAMAMDQHAFFHRTLLALHSINNPRP